jgi:hypothetical protein
VQATPLGDAIADALSVGRPHVLATAAAVLEPTAIEIRTVESVATSEAAAVRTTAPPQFGIQPSW